MVNIPGGRKSKDVRARGDNVFGKTFIFLSIWRFGASKVDPKKIFSAVGGGGGRKKERERD